MVAEPSLRIAVAGTGASPGDVAANLAAADAAAGRAAAAGAALLVLPQRFLTGSFTDAAEASATAILSDGAAARELGAIARGHGVALVCGYVEQCSGRYHDAAMFIDAAGCALANYRRTHLAVEEEAPGLAPGQWLSLVAFSDVKLGLLIGLDVEPPEPARALALAGAAVLLVAAAHDAGAAAAAAAMLATRAFENGCAVAYANGHRDLDAPASRVLGPEGEVLAIAEAGFAVADVPLRRPPATARRLAARRPQLYRKLTAALVTADTPRS